MTDRYPYMPSAKGPDGTSQDAADAIAPCVSYLSVRDGAHRMGVSDLTAASRLCMGQESGRA